MYDWKKSFIIFYCVQFFVCRNVSLCALSAWVGVYCFRSKIGSQSILYSIDILLLKMISIGRRPYTHFIPSIQMKFVLKENYSWIEIFHMIIFCFARRDDGNGNGIERWMIVEIFSSFFFYIRYFVILLLSGMPGNLCDQTLWHVTHCTCLYKFNILISLSADSIAPLKRKTRERERKRRKSARFVFFLFLFAVML